MSGSTGCLRLRGTTYWFRRRVPSALTAIVQRTEINRTLETGQRRLALSRAHILFAITEQIFKVAKGLTDLSLAEEEVAPLIRRLHEESPWSGPTLRSVLADIHQGNGARLNAIIENGERIIDSLPAPKKEQVRSAIAQMMEAKRAHIQGIQAEALAKEIELPNSARSGDAEPH